MEAYRKPIQYLKFWLSAPFIYGMFFAIVILDICVEMYHRVCFPLYGIDYVKRCEYIRIDRHKLQYLSWIEKINCMYCGYANGLAHYFTEIGARTEKYWCGIKHKEDKNFKPAHHHKDFLAYDDKEALDEFLER